MNLKELNEKIRNLDIPEKNKEAFLELMNFKIDNDMDKVLNAIGSLKSETKIVYWVVGIAMAFITILLGLISLIFAFKK